MSLGDYIIQGVPLHHFYLIEGATETSADELVSLLEKEKGDTTIHAHVFTYNTLGVEEAQILRQQQTEYTHDGGAQFFIVYAASVTHEAQQALLKVFEEPKARSHFFLLMPEMTAIVPTVRSRAQSITLATNENKYTKDAQQFIKASIDGRLAFVVDFVKAHEDDDSSGELRLHASQFIVTLIDTLKKDPKNLVLRARFFQDALVMRNYLDTRGASVKMILEHLSLVL